MQYRSLGASGLRVSAVSFGAWVTFGNQLDEDRAHACMRTAFEAGVNFFDNAEAYAYGEAERIMGQVIKRAGWKRSDLVISTKVFWGGQGPNDRGLSRKHVLEGVNASLERLGLDYVDLLFCHRPDLHTPVEETVRAMSHLVNQGKALYWGTSEWTAERIRNAIGIARQEHLVPPTMEQPQYNMFHRERMEKEYRGLFLDPGLGTTIWSPLASGLLTGKYSDGIPKDSRLALESYAWLRSMVESPEGRTRLATVKRLEPMAKEMGATLAQLALAWCLANPNVSSVITGASRPEQVTENLKALDLVPRLDARMMARIDEILANRPVPEEDARD
jgi:voltage-dependent potassium channel beta subunit